MGRFDELGKWLQRERRSAGFKSAAGLAKQAGLSYNYISIVERGELRPKGDTVERIADALGLLAEKRSEFHRLAKTVGESSSVRDALSTLPVPGLATWSSLAPALLRAPRSTYPPIPILTDDAYARAVQSAAGLLAWVALDRHRVSTGDRKSLAAKVGSAIDTLKRERGSDVQASIALLLPALWRDLVFSESDRTTALVRLLECWFYADDWLFPGPAVSFGFMNQRMGRMYTTLAASPADVCEAHAALTAFRLWADLAIDGLIGPLPPTVFPRVAGLIQSIESINRDRQRFEQRDIGDLPDAIARLHRAHLAVRFYTDPRFIRWAGGAWVPSVSEARSSVDATLNAYHKWRKQLGEPTPAKRSEDANPASGDSPRPEF
jgi:transcriptional regulator with XRE-family HTH domain